MSVRKIVGLLAGFALAVGLIGAGVSAQFTDQVKAIQNIQVGTFGCAISSTNSGASLGDYVAGHAHSVSISTDVESSTGSAPFDFTVTSIGSIPVAVSVVQPTVTAPWSNLLVDPGTQYLPTSGANYTYHAGVAWTGLTDSSLGTTGSVTWTVNCTERTQTITSSDLNFGPTGWGGWSCPGGTSVISASVTGGTYASLTLWGPGAPMTGGATYPNTPSNFYTYHPSWSPPESGAIVQNDNTGKTLETTNIN